MKKDPPFPPFEDQALRSLVRDLNREKIGSTVFKTSNPEKNRISKEVLEFVVTTGNLSLGIPEKQKLMNRFNYWIEKNKLGILKNQHDELGRRLTLIVRGRSVSLRFNQMKKSILMACEYDENMEIREQSLGYYAHEDLSTSETEIAILGGFHKIVETDMLSHGISSVIESYALKQQQSENPDEPVLYFTSINFKRES